MKLLYTIKKGGKGKFKKEGKKNQAIWQPQVAHSNKQVAYTNKPSDIWCITDQEPCLKTQEYVTTKENLLHTHIWRRLLTVTETEFVRCKSCKIGCIGSQTD